MSPYDAPALKGAIVASTIFGVLLAVTVASAATVFSAKPTSSCLAAHKLIVTPVPRSAAVPPHVPVLAAISFSFALIPNQGLDHGEVIFERDAATARRAWSMLYAINLASASHVQGIDLAKAEEVIRESLGLHRNVVTIWQNHPTKAASRTRLIGCLR